MSIGPALKKTKHARLAGIVTSTPEKANAWQEKYGLEDSGVYDCDNFDEMIYNPDIDVVLPNSMLCELPRREACLHGKADGDLVGGMSQDDCHIFRNHHRRARVEG